MNSHGVGIRLLLIILCSVQAIFIEGKDNVTFNVRCTVVGAGPSGIAVVGILLDSGVPGNQIVWLDREFNVGRLSHYANVPGNARVQQYINFLKACHAFGACESPHIDRLYAMRPEQTPPLKYIVEPLQDITKYLRKQIVSIQDELVGLDFVDDQWNITTKEHSIQSDIVILATGSHPRQIDYNGKPQIPLDMALDKDVLATQVDANDVVGVIGSAHSALIIVKHLTELPVKYIFNFYKKPIVYPTPMEGGVAWQEAGLKGELATWTQTVLAKTPPKNLKRIFASPEALKAWMPYCNKVVVAVGFERNELPPVNGDASLYAKYDSSSGMIGPRLFGVGIAFPEKKVDPLGNVEYLVGLPFFMPYIQKIVPEWMKKNINRKLFEFNDLFTISIL